MAAARRRPTSMSAARSAAVAFRLSTTTDWPGRERLVDEPQLMRLAVAPVAHQVLAHVDVGVGEPLAEEGRLPRPREPDQNDQLRQSTTVPIAGGRSVGGGRAPADAHASRPFGRTERHLDLEASVLVGDERFARSGTATPYDAQTGARRCTTAGVCTVGASGAREEESRACWHAGGRLKARSVRSSSTVPSPLLPTDRRPERYSRPSAGASADCGSDA
jgi:hypothetical protein